MELIIKPTEVCDFKCTFCSSTNISEKHSTQLDLLTIFRFLRRFPETNTIIVNGGDPLMMPPIYYEKIIEYLDKHEMKTSISFTTNLWSFYKNPKKWLDLFRHPRMGIATSFQYGGGRLKGDYSEFTEEDFRKCSDTMLELVGYRPSFIAVITEENEDTVLKTVELAKEMGVVCKVNHAFASGDQSKPYPLYKIYQHYVAIWEAGLTDWEYNTQQMVKRLRGGNTTCPQNRTCDSGIRTLQPGGDYYSCGAFGDDGEKRINFDYEMKGGFSKPLESDLNLRSLKMACYTCPMFKICNGCAKTTKDLKKHNLVEEHCINMKQLAPKIIEANGLLGKLEVTEYVNEEKEEK